MNKFYIPWILFLILLLFLGKAYADPPARVARLSYMSGTVTFSPAGEENWVYAKLNRPMVTGDRLWMDADGLAELDLGIAAIHLDHHTDVTILNLDDKTAQFQLTQGTLNIHIRQITTGQIYEVDTPNLAFSIIEAGDYRVDVDAQGQVTRITIHQGQGIVYGESGSYQLEPEQTYVFTGNDFNNYQTLVIAELDEFDRWTRERNHRAENVIASQYISPEVVGFNDLDDYGTWQLHETYGHVWIPSNVPADWAPYQEGNWEWIEPWGWTWVGHEPWGFAPYHYGRWVFITDHWAWRPGPAYISPVYAPALVAFIGGDQFFISVNLSPAIGWFPLGPEDIYIPPYRVSQHYFIIINTSNTTIINNIYVTQVYRNPKRHRPYEYQQLPNAVTVVPISTFVDAKSTRHSRIRMDKEILSRGKIKQMADVAPTDASVSGGAKPAHFQPPQSALTRETIIKTPPPPRSVPFHVKKDRLIKTPGKPLTTEEIQGLQGAAGLPPQRIKIPKKVEVITPVQNLSPGAKAPSQPGQIEVPRPPSTRKPVATPSSTTSFPPTIESPTPVVSKPPKHKTAPTVSKPMTIPIEQPVPVTPVPAKKQRERSQPVITTPPAALVTQPAPIITPEKSPEKAQRERQVSSPPAALQTAPAPALKQPKKTPSEKSAQYPVKPEKIPPPPPQPIASTPPPQAPVVPPAAKVTPAPKVKKEKPTEEKKKKTE